VSKSHTTHALAERDRVERSLQECLNELLKNDLCLLQHDASERTITHKLAEYLQDRIPDLHVDCEYNRNVETGPDAAKILDILRADRDEIIRNSPSEDDLLTVSTYPDIIVHRRLTNAENFLVIEVKKSSSRVNHTFDHAKLMAFTDNAEGKPYHYKYGVFILLDTKTETPKKPKLTWFISGKLEPENRSDGQVEPRKAP
jgi:hypothetical protein